MLTADELDRLEALAKTASPGPWTRCSESGIGSADGFLPIVASASAECPRAGDYYGCDSPCVTRTLNIRPNDEPFILAACDPDTILALVEMARRMQVAETELDGLHERSADHIAELTAERDELRKRAEVAEEDATLFRWLLKQSGSLTIWDASMEGFKLKLHGEFYGSSMVNLAAGINEAMAKESAAIAAAKKEQGNG